MFGTPLTNLCRGALNHKVEHQRHGPGELSPQELQIACFAQTGLSNSLGPHLDRRFRPLGTDSGPG
jgi:hypothetical protein